MDRNIFTSRSSSNLGGGSVSREGTPPANDGDEASRVFAGKSRSEGRELSTDCDASRPAAATIGVSASDHAW